MRPAIAPPSVEEQNGGKAHVEGRDQPKPVDGIRERTDEKDERQPDAEIDSTLKAHDARRVSDAAKGAGRDRRQAFAAFSHEHDEKKDGAAVQGFPREECAVHTAG